MQTRCTHTGKTSRRRQSGWPGTARGSGPAGGGVQVGEQPGCRGSRLRAIRSYFILNIRSVGLEHSLPWTLSHPPRETTAALRSLGPDSPLRWAGPGPGGCGQHSRSLLFGHWGTHFVPVMAQRSPSPCGVCSPRHETHQARENPNPALLSRVWMNSHDAPATDTPVLRCCLRQTLKSEREIGNP